MTSREDVQTHTEADAAEFERWRGQAYERDTRPEPSEYAEEWD